MKFISTLLVFLIFEVSQSKHKFFKTGKKNNLHNLFKDYDLAKLSKRWAGVQIVPKRKLVHTGSKK